MIQDEEKLNRELCKVGVKCYYWEPQHAWAIGEIEADDGKHFTVKGLDYSATKVGKLETAKLPDSKVWPAREDVLDEDVSDLLDLTVLHDATIQRCLYVRYMRDHVYTNIGAIVVALNPWNFKIPWYTDDNMAKYLAEGEVVKENPPHSWSQAHNTYHDLRREGEDQTILISGESGAGKTEAAKIVMKYLGCISCLHGAESQKENARRVAFNINQASPVLEGFGNAKTVRNDNSSRFGKFMKVQFDEAGSLIGAFTSKYLLEKSRIVTASPNERVYHAFYLLSKGKDAATYGISDKENSHINSGGCIDIPGVDDGEDYDLCITAMKDCGFSDTEVNGIWRVVAGIFLCLRIEFEEIDADTCKLKESTRHFTEAAAEQWQIDASKFEEVLMSTTLHLQGNDVVKLHRLSQSLDTRDAVCKALYDETFGWEVLKINENTDAGGSSFIGLLDIFGFEDFEHNSFEQICINLANETLQNHYNNFIFTKDMDECKAEGIDVTEVKCPDNAPCLQMLTDKVGIFGLLDDESLLGAGTDQKFCDAVQENWSSNPFFATKKMATNSFIIHHYAASVTYTVTKWLDKNRDTLKGETKSLLRSSAHPLVATLLPEHDENAKKITVGGLFIDSLSKLMQLINSTAPHWIRCIKPHPVKQPLKVHGITTMAQLESSGVLGTVKIRKAGYPVRPLFIKFCARFKVMVPGPYPPMDSPSDKMAELSKKILDAASLGKARAQVGKTRVFLKNEANQFLEAEREKALADHVVCIKRSCYYRLSKIRVRTREWSKAAAEIQYEVREWLSRTAVIRAELRAKRQEQDRLFAQQQSHIISEEENGRTAIEDDAHSVFHEIRSQLYENSRMLQMKADNDRFLRGDLLEKARLGKVDILDEALAPLQEWKAAMVELLLDSLLAHQDQLRSEIMEARDREWATLIATFDYELGFVQLRTIHTTEMRFRILLLQLEALQRQETMERCHFLQIFIDSLEVSVSPWLDSLGAVRYWSEHIKKRKERIKDTRTHINEMKQYEEEHSASTQLACHRDATERIAIDKVWKGCSGVPDVDQMQKSMDRPSMKTPRTVQPGKQPLDGSSSSPTRDCSPLRMVSVTGIIGSPSRTGGKNGTRLVAKSPCVPDYVGHQQRRKEEEGVAEKLGNIGNMTPAQFLTTRRVVVERFVELRDAGEYVFGGPYTYVNNITTARSLRLAQDELHDVRAALCSKLAKQLSSKTSFAKRNGVLEQSKITGKWAPFETPRWAFAEFQDDPTKWPALKAEVGRVSYCIQNHKKTMLRVLSTAAGMGHTVLADCTEQTPYAEVSSVYAYWEKSHTRTLYHATAPQDVKFTAVCKHYGGNEVGITIPSVHPSPGPNMSMPKTPKQHIEAVSPPRFMS